MEKSIKTKSNHKYEAKNMHYNSGDPHNRLARNSGLLVEQCKEKSLPKWYRWFYTKIQILEEKLVK